MLVYVCLLIMILVLNNARKKGRLSGKFFCITICCAFILITGLRHNSVGSDTTVYYLGFYQISNLSFTEMISLGNRDVGFYVFEWLVANVFNDFAAVTFLAACVFYIPVSVLIYRYSDDYGLSYLILMAFMFFQFSMTGIRQTMALGFAILFVLELLKNRTNLFWLVLWIVLGVAMHRSCLVILTFLIIYFLRENKNIAITCLVLVPFVFLFRTNITGMAISLFDAIGFELEQYSGDSGGGTTFLVYLMLLIFGLFFTYSRRRESSIPPILLTIMGIATVLQIFVFVNSIFFRIVWYYSIYLTIYIPKMISSARMSGRNALLLRTFVYCGLLFMYLGITIGSANVVPYRFFWQGL